MYCSECGNALPANSLQCPRCKAVTVSGETSEKEDFQTYEYKSILARRGMEQLYFDCYSALGWERTVAARPSLTLDKAMLSFKRSRNSKNNIELSKYQLRLDAILAEIARIEEKKESAGTLQSLSAGVVAALILGGGMSLFLCTTQQVLGVIIGVLGLIACAFPYYIFKRYREKEGQRLSTLLDEQYDEASQVCEQAHRLLE